MRYTADKTPYEDIPLLPNLIAETVANRAALEPSEIAGFMESVDDRCRAAYESGARWFLVLVNCPGNLGRDQLYVECARWLADYQSQQSAS